MSWTIKASLDIQEVLRLLLKRVPCSDSWMQEAYGGQGTAVDKDIKKVLWCVTAKQDMVPYCEEHGYDLIVSHHPIMITGFPQIVLHTALDCTIGGLNDMWKDALGVRGAKHFDKNLGWYGAIDPIKFGDLVAKCQSFIEGPITGRKYADDGDETVINSVVICTGLGGMVEDMAVKTGADCWIFGEGVYASTYYNFKSFIEIGHTQSEKIGVKLIREVLEPHGIQVDVAPTSLDWYGVENPNYPPTKWEKEKADEDMEYGIKKKKEFNEDPNPNKVRTPMGKWEKPYKPYVYPTQSYPPAYNAYYDDYVSTGDKTKSYNKEEIAKAIKQWKDNEHEDVTGPMTDEEWKEEIAKAIKQWKDNERNDWENWQAPAAPGTMGTHPAPKPGEQTNIDWDKLSEEEWNNLAPRPDVPNTEMTPADWDRVFEGKPPTGTPPATYPSEDVTGPMTDEEWEAWHQKEEDQWLAEQGYSPEQIAEWNKKMRDEENEV